MTEATAPSEPTATPLDGGTRRYGITIPFDGVPLTEHKRWYEDLLRLGYTDVWSAETDGLDGFTPLALAAAWTPALQLGVAIIPAYTRGPALLAQSVAAMAEAAPGHFTFGLGTSSDVIVSRWNGVPFDEPYKRVRDTIAFLRDALAGEKVTTAYDTFEVKGFRLARPVEQPPPIFLAALRPGGACPAWPDGPLTGSSSTRCRPLTWPRSPRSSAPTFRWRPGSS
jgi:alkanesulfonate monooxygenase SsuD/methylene tetrahydromethanopterin reductase-like flavin-dependent oxidoreductase (luciferase family)